MPFIDLFSSKGGLSISIPTDKILYFEKLIGNQKTRIYLSDNISIDVDMDIEQCRRLMEYAEKEPNSYKFIEVSIGGVDDDRSLLINVDDISFIEQPKNKEDAVLIVLKSGDKIKTDETWESLSIHVLDEFIRREL